MNSTDDSLRVGDTAKHLSGGPRLFVAEIADSGVWCEWFTKNDEFRRELFPLSAVRWDEDAAILEDVGIVRQSRMTREQRIAYEREQMETRRLMWGLPPDRTKG